MRHLQLGNAAFKFSNHDDALKAGLTIGTVVYGVPLQVGGSFDQKKTEEWKEQNCSRTAQSSSFQGASFRYLREVAPGAMAAYVECIKSHEDRGALTCSLTREPGALIVKWRRNEGEALEAAPIVSRVMTINGECQPGLLKDAIVSEGGVATPCVADAKKRHHGYRGNYKKGPLYSYGFIPQEGLSGSRKCCTGLRSADRLGCSRISEC